MSEKIKVSLADHILTITLNRPEKLNCLDQEMLDALEAAIERAERDPMVKAVVLRGAGERAFSTGADLKAFRVLDSEGANQWIMAGNRLFNRIEQLLKPTLAVIRGYALGGGMELALACDFRLADASAVFSSPELQHGWLPGWGAMARLRRLLGEAKAKEVVLLAQKIGAEDAFRLGLLTRLAPADELGQVLESTLTNLLKVPPMTFALAKTTLMDEHRSTSGADMMFDVLALNLTNLTT